VSVLLVYESSAHPQRRSFPTRRSSDLTGEVSTTWNVLTWGDGLAPHDGFEFGQSGTPGKIGFVQLETETSPPLYRLAVVLGSSHDTAAPGNHTHTPAQIGAVPTERQVIAGTGLIGGGALSSDVTL